MAASSASATPPSSIDTLAAPEDVRAALHRLRDNLSRAARENLVALVLYGGLARGRYRPGSSDVNVVVLLRDASEPELAAIAPVMREAWRSICVDPMILTPDEMPRVAESFPLKFLDVKEHHVVLLGEDPFPDLVVPAERIRVRVQQELRNLSLRLRRSYIAVSDDPLEVARAIGRAAVSLAVQLAGLLYLHGHTLPDDGVEAVFSSAAESFDLDRDILDRVQAVRSEGPGTADLRGLYDGVLRTIGRALEVAEGRTGS